MDKDGNEYSCDKSTKTICPSNFDPNDCIVKKDMTPSPTMAPTVPTVSPSMAPTVGPSVTSLSPTQAPTQASAKDNTGKIVGGVIGGLCGVGIIAIIALFAVKYKREEEERSYDRVSGVDA